MPAEETVDFLRRAPFVPSSGTVSKPALSRVEGGVVSVYQPLSEWRGEQTAERFFPFPCKEGGQGLCLNPDCRSQPNPAQRFLMPAFLCMMRGAFTYGTIDP
jgi:hypothetical protein